jgi:hypothetical protein
MRNKCVACVKDLRNEYRIMVEICLFKTRVSRKRNKFNPKRWLFRKASSGTSKIELTVFLLSETYSMKTSADLSTDPMCLCGNITGFLQLELQLYFHYEMSR